MSTEAIQQFAEDHNKHDVLSLGRSLSMDSTLAGVPKPISSISGMSTGGDSMLQNGWPLTRFDQFPNLGDQVFSPLLPVTEQRQKFIMPPDQNQHGHSNMVVAQRAGKQISSFSGSSTNFGGFMLPRSELSGKGGLMMAPYRQGAMQQLRLPLTQNVEQPKLQQRVPMRQPAEKRKNDQDGRNMVSDKSAHSNVHSFLSHDVDDPYVKGTVLKKSRGYSTAKDNNDQTGFSFGEVYHLQPSNDKMLCCTFSSDGKLLASAGQEKKVMIWNTETSGVFYSTEHHSHHITDVRFAECSTIFATSSLDRTVQIWDAATPRKPLFKLFEHSAPVTSIDFHPRKMELLGACDSNDTIQLWNVNQGACTYILKGGSRQIRFQPQNGNLLAAAAGNVISVFNTETVSLLYHLKGHVKEIRSICWDTSGKFIASVSEDSARVWSTLSRGKCIYELNSNGDKFESCSFHPGYSLLLVMGAYKQIVLWNPTESNKTMRITAHDDTIAALADSPQTEMIASASHDHIVKIWK